MDGELDRRWALWDVAHRVAASRAAPNLDALFVAAQRRDHPADRVGLRPTGAGSVCFRAAEGAAFAETQRRRVALLDNDDEPRRGAQPATRTASPGCVSGDPTTLAALFTDLHAVNTSLATQGFAHGLLCSLVAFADTAGRRVGLVYLYKQGTFYPFAPAAPAARSATTCSRSRSATCSPPTCRSRRTSALAGRSGARPASDLVDSLGQLARRRSAEWPCATTGVWPTRRAGAAEFTSQSRWVLPGRSSIRCEGDLGPVLGVGVDLDLVDHVPATRVSSAQTKWGRSMRFIVEQ